MTTISIDRVETYLEEKASIVDAIEASLYPLFQGLMAELEEEARTLVGAQPPDEWGRKMMEILDALGPHHISSGCTAPLTTLRDILNIYESNTGLRLSSTLMYESGLDPDEVNFTFDCDAWRALFRKELSSSYELGSVAFIWVEHFDRGDNAGVHVKELYHFELADLRIIRDAFDTYWHGALQWVKMRRSYLE